MKKFVLLLIIIFSGMQCLALEIVYPKKDIVTINSASTFFIGSSNSPLTINGEKIDLHPSGGFAYPVKLNIGENVFDILSADELKTYKITRLQSKTQVLIQPDYIEYSNPKILITTFEDTPLRSTAIDGGINRLSHLQKDIPMLALGEKRGFYNISLNNGLDVWVAKSHAKEIEDPSILTPAKILNNEKSETDEFYIYKIMLNKKVPFIIEEGEKIKLQLFNIENEENNTFSLQAPKTKQLGYCGYYEDNTFVLKIRKAIPKKLTISIDPGHGGNEFGAIGCCGDKEKDINLKISLLLKEELKKRGYNPIITRETDIAVSLKDRVNFAKKNNATLSISIHANALPDSGNPLKARGTSIYFYYPQAKSFAEEILTTMTKELNTENDRVRQGSLALVRCSDALSILIEVGYLINPDDNAMLIDSTFQKHCAQAIADGIDSYLLDK